MGMSPHKPCWTWGDSAGATLSLPTLWEADFEEPQRQQWLAGRKQGRGGSRGKEAAASFWYGGNNRAKSNKEQNASVFFQEIPAAKVMENCCTEW